MRVPTSGGNRRPRLVRGIALVVFLALGAPPAAAQDASVLEQNSPLLEHADQMMIDIGAQLTNARKRLTLSDGVVKSNPNGGESGMGLTCCTDNLRTIAVKLQKIRDSINRMAAYYSEQGNGKAMGILGELDSRVLSVATGAALFGRAEDQQAAFEALTGFVRPWNEFRNGIQSLRLCCPIPIPVDPAAEGGGEPDGKEKKQRKKKSGKRETSGEDPG